jgi:hypothetical protein
MCCWLPLVLLTEPSHSLLAGGGSGTDAELGRPAPSWLLLMPRRAATPPLLLLIISPGAVLPPPPALGQPPLLLQLLLVRCSVKPPLLLPPATAAAAAAAMASPAVLLWLSRLGVVKPQLPPSLLLLCLRGLHLLSMLPPPHTFVCWFCC